MRNIRNCAVWITLGVLEYFFRPLLTCNKNAQLEQERGSAALLAKLLGQPQQNPPRAPPAPPKTAASTVPKGQLREEDPEGGHWARVLQSPFLFCLKLIPDRDKPPYPRGVGEVAAEGRRGARE